MNGIDRDELVSAMTEALGKVWEVKAVPWGDFVADLLKGYSEGLRAPATLRAIRHDLGLLSALVVQTDDGQPVLGADGRPLPLVRTTADLTIGTIARFVLSQPPHLSPYSIRSRLRSIRIACNIAVKAGQLQVSPFAIRNLATWVRVGRLTGKRTLTREEVRRIFAILEEDIRANQGWNQWRARRIQALVYVYAYCGLRKVEALCLRVEDVDLPGLTIHVRARKDHRLKTNSSAAPVPIPEAAVPVLSSWLAHRNDAPRGFQMPGLVPWCFPGSRRTGPWTGGAPGTRALDVFQDIARRAGVPDATIQMLRRTLSTLLRSHGASAGVASKILRHSIEVDEAFYHGADMDELRDAVRTFDF
jgi:integrase